MNTLKYTKRVGALIKFKRSKTTDHTEFYNQIDLKLHNGTALNQEELNKVLSLHVKNELLKCEKANKTNAGVRGSKLVSAVITPCLAVCSLIFALAEYNYSTIRRWNHLLK